MKLKYIVFLFFSLISLSAGAQSIMIDDDIADKELQIERCLQQMDVDYSTKYDARQFGLPAPDSYQAETPRQPQHTMVTPWSSTNLVMPRLLWT